MYSVIFSFRWKQMRWLDSVPDSMEMNLSKLPEAEGDEGPGVLQPMGLQSMGRDGVTKGPQQRGRYFFASFLLL